MSSLSKVAWRFSCSGCLEEISHRPWQERQIQDFLKTNQETMRSHQSNPGDQQGFAGFPTNLQTLSLGFVQNVQELQVNGSNCCTTSLCLSFGYHYVYFIIYIYLVYLVYLSTMFVWSQGYFMMPQHECHTLQTPNFKNSSIRI